MAVLAQILAVSAVFAIGCAFHDAVAQDGDIGKGANHARQVCARCHAIRKGDELSSHPNAPSFETIANTSGVSKISLATILRSTHESMPNFVLAPDEQDNIIAYILSLKQR